MIELTLDNFNDVVADATVPVLVDFWAPWCGPCRTLMPMLEKMESHVQEHAKFCKVNIDEHPDLASQFGIRGVPTVLIFDGAQITGQLVGLQSPGAYLSALGLT